MTSHDQPAAALPPLHSYIIVRSDLPLQAQMAQCAHAAQESAFLLGGDPGRPIHVVILSCPSEEALLAAADRLARKGFDAGVFFEPDWPRGHTALYLRPQARSSALRAAMGAYPLWSAPPAQSGVWVEQTEEPLNPSIVITPEAETHARMCHLLHKTGVELGDSAYYLREQLEKAGLDAREVDALDRLAALIDSGGGPEGWALACDEPGSGYAEFRSYLSEGHAGDCTCAPCSCIRCHAEAALGLSTRPANKHEGYRMLMAQVARRKAREASAREALP